MHSLDSFVSVLLRRSVVPATASTDWPLEAPTADTDLLAAVATVVTMLDDERSVVAALPERLDDHDLTVATWNLLSLFARPVPQYDTGELVYPVEVRPDESGASHYSASADAGGLHTDGSLLAEPPDLGALLCLSKADEGGETVLVDARSVYEHLRDAPPHLLPVVTGEHPFATEDDRDRPRQWGPLMRVDGGEVTTRYLRKYIVAGWRLTGAPAPELLVEALDAIDEFAGRASQQQAYPLRRGEVLVWHNHRHLHGRRAFTERASRRRLVRFYGRRDDSRPVPSAVSAGVGSAVI
ncbi:MAG: TauD/TfdA family dioxygenase [Streptosporangiaceae bacterium]|nr:TauD/TfdA family dioxygenase [Streptosporangiaceae bacterium]